MGRYIVQRLFLLIPTFVGVTLVGFLVMHLAPGDPAELRAAGGLGGGRVVAIKRNKQGGVDEALSQWRKQYGLDRPLPIQYAVWLKNLVTLNFGESFKDNQSVWNKIIERVPVTVKINVFFLLLVYLIVIRMGIYSATHSNSLGDQITTLVAFVLFAVPLICASTMATVIVFGWDVLLLFPPE